MRPSPLSGGYSQQSLYPRRPSASPRAPHRPLHAQFSGYDYQQRGAHPSQGLKYPRPSYDNYPPLHSPRSNFGPSWERRPPASMHGASPQGSYNYSNQPPRYSQMPVQRYVGYNELKYDQSAPQHFGHMVSQPTTHAAQGGAYSGYGPHNQFKPPLCGMQPSYSQAKLNQPGEVPYQGPVSSYGQNVAPQQSYSYPSTGPVQQSYPPYGSAPSTGGYSPAPAPAPSSGYPPQGLQQPPTYTYAQAGPSGGYGSYPTAHPAYTQQPAANSGAYGSHQVPADPTLGGGAQGPAAAAYPAVQSGYPQTGQTQAGGYGNSVSSQSVVYPQYDTNQMYGSHV